MYTFLSLTFYRFGIYVHIYGYLATSDSLQRWNLCSYIHIYIYIYIRAPCGNLCSYLCMYIYIYISGLRVISDKCTFLRGKYKSFLVILGHTAAGGNTVYTFLPLTLSPDLESMFIYVHIYIYTPFYL